MHIMRFLSNLAQQKQQLIMLNVVRVEVYENIFKYVVFEHYYSLSQIFPT